MSHLLRGLCRLFSASRPPPNKSDQTPAQPHAQASSETSDICRLFPASRPPPNKPDQTHAQPHSQASSDTSDNREPLNPLPLTPPSLSPQPLNDAVSSLSTEPDEPFSTTPTTPTPVTPDEAQTPPIKPNHDNYNTNITVATSHEENPVNEHQSEQPTPTSTPSEVPAPKKTSWKITSQCTAAINALLEAHQAPQVVFFGTGESALATLQSPSPPPVKIYIVEEDNVDDTVPIASALQQSLPVNMTISPVYTPLATGKWDVAMVLQGYDWLIASTWVVHLYGDKSPLNSFTALDVFLLMVKPMTNAASSILMVYRNVDSQGASFPEEEFVSFARRRGFRILSDRTLFSICEHFIGEVDNDNQLDEHVRIAVLAHSADEDHAKAQVKVPVYVDDPVQVVEALSEHDQQPQQHKDPAQHEGHKEPEEVRDDSTTTMLRTQSVENIDITNGQTTETKEKDMKERNSLRIHFQLRTDSLPHASRSRAVSAIVIGNSEALGCWKPSHACVMEGNLTASSGGLYACVEIAKGTGALEYKYALLGEFGDVVEWESGDNRILAHDGGIGADSETADVCVSEHWRS